MERLYMWQMNKVVIHFDRNNSGKIGSGKSWIRLHKAGTPDITAYIRYKNICAIYFIECKASHIKLEQPIGEQLKFMLKFKNIENVWYDLVNDPAQVDNRIESITNYTKNVFKEMDKIF